MTFKNCNDDFKNKIKKRIDILFSRKRCSKCFSHLDRLDLPVDNMLKSVSFYNKENLSLSPFSGKRCPIDQSVTDYEDFYSIKLRQNKPKKINDFKIKFLILCKKCGEPLEIKSPEYFFG